MSDESDSRIERVSFSETRHHVGAAGLDQRHVLEEIIAAGREQIAVAQALRKVLALTLEQQRSMPLVELGASLSAQQAALQQIMTSGQAQVETAQELRATIQQVLSDVRETPLELISSHLLTTLGASVHQQVQDLNDIIQVAVGQASSLEQIVRLEEVSAQTATRLRETEHTRNEHELVELIQQAAQALSNVRRLEQEGQTHAEQKRELIAETQTTQQHIDTLEEANAADQREITQLEDERDVAQAREQEMGEVAEQLQQNLEILRPSKE